MITKNDEKKKFKKYSVYGWGLPFIVCLPCRIMRFYVSYTSRLDLEIVILRLMTLCFGSVLILVGFNTTWFLIIIWQIHKLYKQRRTLLLDKNNRGKQKERNKMFLYFKFFLIMGVIRIPELLLTVYKDVRMRDMIVNVLHIIEGVMTFVIFICKRRILHAVNNKMCPSLIIFKNIDQRDHSNDVLLLKPTASTSSTHCSGASNSDQNENKM
ncbi:G-protein coupled receptor Mth2-like [Lycorma delicatula]|uniref:G-protein coupled receptor Mth2-like n=1 Tax=Lycorma delicatula TaxID=130591 RepID=UPI003F514EF4